MLERVVFSWFQGVGLQANFLLLPCPFFSFAGLSHEHPTLEFEEQAQKPDDRLGSPTLKILGHILEKLGDRQILRALLFTFPALHALRGHAGFPGLSQSPESEQIHDPLDLFVAENVGAVMNFKARGDIHP